MVVNVIEKNREEKDREDRRWGTILNRPSPRHHFNKYLKEVVKGVFHTKEITRLQSPGRSVLARRSVCIDHRAYRRWY